MPTYLPNDAYSRLRSDSLMQQASDEAGQAFGDVIKPYSQDALDGVKQEADSQAQQLLAGYAQPPQNDLTYDQAPGPPEASPPPTSGAAQPPSQPSQYNASGQYGPDAQTSTPAPATAPGTAFTQTTAGLSGGGAAAAPGLTDRARSIMANAADTASWLGSEGQKALQAILVTEGGMNNAVGDTDRSTVGSHGPLQFYGGGGQLNTFAAQAGMTLSQAADYVKQYPDAAVKWAIGTPDHPGYLGGAIANGQRQGLSGPALATFAQRTGQVSDSPERAGANYAALFGGGGGPVSGGAAQTAIRAETGAGQPVGGSPQDSASLPAPASIPGTPSETAAATTPPTSQDLLDQVGRFWNDQASKVIGDAAKGAVSAATKTLTGSTPAELGQAASDLFAPDNPLTHTGAALATAASQIPAAADALQQSGVGQFAADVQSRTPLGIATNAAQSASTALGGSPMVGPQADMADEAQVKLLQGEALTPEEQQALTNRTFMVGGMTGPVGARSLSTQETNFLRSEVLVPKSDPRPPGWSDPGLPNVKSVQQANLGEVVREGDLLYHETSVPAARQVVNRFEQGPRSQNVWASDNPDLALGQGGKGVLLEIDPALVNGSKSQNPVHAFSDASGQGAEYMVNRSVRGAVRAIYVRTQRQIDQLATDPAVRARFDLANPEPTDMGLRITRKGPPPALPDTAAPSVGGFLRSEEGSLSPGPIAKAATGPVNDVFAPARNTPPVVQQAISDFANTAGMQARAASVSAENLAARVRQVLGPLDTDPAVLQRFEQTGTFSATPTPAQDQLAADLRAYFQQSGVTGRAGGYIHGDVTTAPGGPNFYFPHAYEDTGPATGGGLASFNPRGDYSNPRSFLTFAEAQSTGLKPLPASQLVQDYAQHVAVSQAKVDLANALKGAGPDVAIARPQGRLPTGMQGYRPIADPSFGSPFNGWLFEPKTARAVDNLIANSSLRSNGVGSALMQGLSVGKQTLFSLSNFHTATETLNGLFANGLRGPGVVRDMTRAFWSPNFYQGIRYGKLADDFANAAHAGVTGLAAPVGDVEQLGNLGRVPTALIRAGVGGATGYAGGYNTAKSTGASDEDAIKAGLASGAATAALGPKLAPWITRALWERAVPTAKVLTYKIATEGGADGKAAADFVNNTFGGQNLAAMARGRTTQDMARVLALAPDWTESTWKTVANTFAPTQTGTLTRNYVLSSLASLGFVTEAINYALNGHTTDQNAQGHQFQIQIPTGQTDRRGLPDYTYVAIFPGNQQQVLDAISKRDPNAYITNRTAPLPRALADWQGNKDFAGNDIVPQGTPPFAGIPQYLGYEAGRFAPVGVSNVGNELNHGAPLWMGLGSSLTGLKLAHETGTSAIMQQRDQLVTAKWPDYERQVRASAAFQKANPAEQANLLRDERVALGRDIGLRLGLPGVDTGLPQKYLGVTDRTLEARIDQALARVRVWDTDPGHAPPPTATERRLAMTYEGRANPLYQRAVAQRTGANRGLDRLRSSVTDDVPVSAPIPSR